MTSCMRVRAEEYPVMLACSATAHGDKRKVRGLVFHSWRQCPDDLLCVACLRS